jgi:hypothetical protein
MALDYMDFEGIMYSIMTIDEYAAKMGTDADIVTLTFMMKSKMAAEDLVTWLERGYQYILDASVSVGELEPGKWLVFVELERRLRAPERIIKVLNDLTTLTGYELEDWSITVTGQDAEPSIAGLTEKMILVPGKYKVEKDIEDDELLEEYRHIAGVDAPAEPKEYDEELENFKSIAGL